MGPTLITIPISHYGERARWALDHAELDYDEVHHLQLFSWFAAYRAGGRRSLPVLVTSERVLTDSADIVRYASERAAAPLVPADPAEREVVTRWEERFAGEYGVETRRVVYEWVLRSLDVALPFNAGRAPELEVLAMRGMRSVARGLLRSYLRVSPESAARGREVTLRTMDDVAETLRDGRRYLTGDCFTSADLTFAAMSAPAVLPLEYPVPLPRVDEIPADAAEWIGRLREHPAGQFALRLYAERPPFRGRTARPLRVQR